MQIVHHICNGQVDRKGHAGVGRMLPDIGGGVGAHDRRAACGGSRGRPNRSMDLDMDLKSPLLVAGGPDVFPERGWRPADSASLPVRTSDAKTTGPSYTVVSQFQVSESERTPKRTILDNQLPHMLVSSHMPDDIWTQALTAA